MISGVARGEKWGHAPPGRRPWGHTKTLFAVI